MLRLLVIFLATYLTLACGVKGNPLPPLPPTEIDEKMTEKSEAKASDVDKDKKKKKKAEQ